MSMLPEDDGALAEERAVEPTAGDYVVMARRYRPQTFADLVGQEPVARALSNAIATNRVGHAYLFTGARGVGKTSTARILAKALNCVQGPTPTPCNQCDICQSISSGEDVDVLEIDGASNRGIDEIRELRQNVNIRPSRARFKIYIIDEVHMLTMPAFNALLKTLEEPPERVKFIFCTTEAEKIPITILSRCQRFDFAGIETQSIAERLQQIAQAEGVEIEREAVELLARRAAGSMRDSQSLMEQLLAFGGRNITVADVHSMLGTAASGRVTALVENLGRADAGAALADLDRILSEGVDVGQLLVQLLGFYRDVLVSAVGGANLLFTGPAELPAVKESARQLGADTVLAVMQILDQALARMRFVTQPRVIAELALVRIARLENLTALSELIQTARSGDVLSLPAEGAEGSTTSGATSGAVKKKLAEPTEERTSNRDATIGSAGGATEVASAAEIAQPIETAPSLEPASPGAGPAAVVLTAESATSIWHQAVASLQDTVAEFARTATEAKLTGSGKLVVSFPAEYSYSRTMCQRPEKLVKLEQAVTALTAVPVKIEFELLPSSAGAASNRPEAASRVRPSHERLAESAEHPLVRRAIDLFRARPVRVEEPKT